MLKDDLTTGREK